MKKLDYLIFAILFVVSSCQVKQQNHRSITPDSLKDKIAGGWAGKMIGVTYGAPTEFHAQGKLFTDSIKWKSSDIKGSLWQDDLYVQLTFLMSMDQFGMDAPAKKFQEMFALAGYPLWHANVQARKNFYDSIFPPMSGNPEFNIHADDIDFQIEADYIGFMCPGLPQKAQKIADKIGHIMNYGDGVYGGIFVASLYAEAFFEDNIPNVIEKALKSIPAESDYAKIVRDVILLHQHNPNDWKAAWKELENKWGEEDICGAGITFNIDAKLNGAYIVMGLLYGDGDPLKTLEISTRCGQDSDCNPSNALAVLGVIKGLSHFPEDMKQGIQAIGDSVFINTNYSFNKAVDNTYKYAIDFIKDCGGSVADKEIQVIPQESTPALLEISFPDVVLDKKIEALTDPSIQWKGDWKKFQQPLWGKTELIDQSKYSGKKDDEMNFTFNGTGIAIMGNWTKDGGKAIIYLDGKVQRPADTYYNYNKQEQFDICLWHNLKLQPGEHHLQVVVSGDKKKESLNSNIYITSLLIFKTQPKNSKNFKFSFEK